MTKQNLTLIVLLLILTNFFASCKPESKSEETHTPNISVCGVEDPLTDLPWLKDIITELEGYVSQGYPVSYRIYQCIYKDGIGFLLDNLELIYDKAIPLINCEGRLLCELVVPPKIWTTV